MFVVILTYKKSLELVDQYLEEHIAFLNAAYKNNYFLASGRRNPRTGGVIISHLTDRAQLENLLAEDPFYSHEIAEYEIIEFTPSKYHQALAGLLQS